MIEDFFDSLFGGDDTALPAPTPPMGPRYRPQADVAPEQPDPEDAADMADAEAAAVDDAMRAAEARDNRPGVPLSAPPAPRAPQPPEADGPYRQPEADPDEPSPF